MTGFMAGSHVGWCVAAWLPSHIQDSWGHYSDGDNGHFLRKQQNVCMNQRKWYHFHGFLTPNCTIKAQCSAKLCCFIFMSKRISQHVSKILADILLTCCLAGWDGIFLAECWAYIFHILPAWQHVWGCHVIWEYWRHNTALTFPTK